jgi:hypothetical protein
MKIYIVYRVFEKDESKKKEYLDCFNNPEDVLEFIMKCDDRDRIEYTTKDFEDSEIAKTEFRKIVVDDKPPLIDYPSIRTFPKNCKDWTDCTNPFKDCLNCPLRGVIYTSTGTDTINGGIPLQEEKNEKNK